MNGLLTQELMNVIVHSEAMIPVLSNFSYENLRGLEDVSSTITDENRVVNPSNFYDLHARSVDGKTEAKFVEPNQYLSNLSSIIKGNAVIPSHVKNHEEMSDFLTKEPFNDPSFRETIFMKLYLSEYLPAIGIDPDRNDDDFEGNSEED